MLPLRDHLPTRRVPFINYAILFANVAMFLWERVLLAQGVDPERLVLVFGLVPERFTASPSSEWLNIFSSMFTHDPSGWTHIGGNMLFLWIFGDNVEDAIGHSRYVLFYVLAGLVAAMTQIAVGPHSAVPMIGASGAIAGVLAAYVTLYPLAPITVLNPFFPLWIFWFFLELPAWFVIGLFFILNLWYAFGSLGSAGAGIAFFAHVGGFVAGLVLIRFFVEGRGPRDYEPWSGFRPPPGRARPWRVSER
jgi:membrane associated rhomboid family serine protease